jgi:hypothetical protein
MPDMASIPTVPKVKLFMAVKYLLNAVRKFRLQRRWEFLSLKSFQTPGIIIYC